MPKPPVPADGITGTGEDAPRLSCTKTELAQLFAEWDRRYRAAPLTFMTEVEHLLGETPHSYGDACAEYFVEFLASALLPHRIVRGVAA